MYLLLVQTSYILQPVHLVYHPIHSHLLQEPNTFDQLIFYYPVGVFLPYIPNNRRITYRVCST